MINGMRDSLLRAVLGRDRLVVIGGVQAETALATARRRGVKFLVSTSKYVLVSDDVSPSAPAAQAGEPLVSPFPQAAFCFRRGGTAICAIYHCRHDRALTPGKIVLLFVQTEGVWHWVPIRYTVDGPGVTCQLLRDDIRLDRDVRSFAIQSGHSVFAAIVGVCRLLQLGVAQVTSTISIDRMPKAAASAGTTGDEYRIILAPQPRPKDRADLGGAHASPRLHDRRAHVRRLASGRTTPVKACKVGDPSRGRIIKDYTITPPCDPTEGGSP